MKPLRFLTISLAALVLLGSPCWAQDNAADTKRLIESLQLKPGDVVAEIGAGNGDLTIAIANHVGKEGRVFSSELGAERIKSLRTAIEKSGVSNVQVIEGHETTANLPDACCNAIFMRNVYHHFADPAAMHASFLRALKPGARIAVIDFSPRKGDTAAPGKRAEEASHGVSEAVVAEELRTAGFALVSDQAAPLPRRSGPGADNRWFIVVAEKRQD